MHRVRRTTGQGNTRGERARPGGNNVKPFVVNRHGRLVFPANFLGELDFSVLESLDQFTAVIGRDFEAKAPTGTDILARVEAGSYPGRGELLRDLVQNLFWVNRYAITRFDKRPTRWRDLPKHRDDVFLPVLTPWEDSERKVAAVESTFRALPATWDDGTENRIFELLFGVFSTKLHHATELPAIKPTVAEFLDRPDALTFVMPDHDPDYPAFSLEDIIDAHEDVPELEALMRWAMVLHNQYPWERSRTELRGPGQIGDDDFVVAFVPRDRDTMAFIDRVRRSARGGKPATLGGQDGPLPRGDRRGAGQHVHEQPADPVDRLLAVRRARPAADARLSRPDRGVRRAAVRHVRGHPAAAGGRPAGAAGLRGEVLRQDRQRPNLADDLRRRRRGHGHRAGPRGRPRRRGGRADLRQRTAHRGQLDHLAELGFRQRHHRVRPGGEVPGPALSGADAGRARPAARSR